MAKSSYQAKVIRPKHGLKELPNISCCDFIISLCGESFAVFATGTQVFGGEDAEIHRRSMNSFRISILVIGSDRTLCQGGVVEFRSARDPMCSQL